MIVRYLGNIDQASDREPQNKFVLKCRRNPRAKVIMTLGV